MRFTKAQRLKWVGSNMVMVRSIMEQIPLWLRKKGRPKKDWMNEDLRTLGIQDWKSRCITGGSEGKLHTKRGLIKTCEAFKNKEK